MSRDLDLKNIKQFIKNLPFIIFDDTKNGIIGFFNMVKDQCKVGSLYAYFTIFFMLSLITWHKKFMLFFGICWLFTFLFKKYDSGKDIELEKKKKNNQTCSGINK
jgi:hypothetical protein